MREREREREEERIQKSARKKLPRQFSRLFDSGPISLGFSWESLAADTWSYVAYVYNGELVPLMGNQRVGIFPPKSEILFVLSLALKWYRNFQDRTIPVGGDTWTSFCRKEGIRIIRIKKYPRSGLFFRSNISKMVGDIRVLFSLWPRAIVALPNGANDVSVVYIVSEIWRRQHQNFGMLTYTNERNQYPFEWIRTANKNKEISRSGSRFRSNISETVRDIRVPFSLLGRCKSHATKRCNPRLCSCYRFWDIVVANINNFPILLEQTRIWRRTSSHAIIRIMKYRVQGSCFRSNISETVKDIRVPFSLLARCKSHATKRCNPRLCSCYRFWDIVVANINNFPILLEQTRICRRTSSHGIIIKIRIKKYRVQGSRFRSNISETVRDIRVSF